MRTTTRTSVVLSPLPDRTPREMKASLPKMKGKAARAEG